MHLFASFIARASMLFLKDILFASGVDNSIGLTSQNWLCKAITVIWEYCILANYSWILMEGLYLYNLLFTSMFVEGQGRFYLYVVTGWGECNILDVNIIAIVIIIVWFIIDHILGLPAVVIGAWAILRIIFENKYCWTTHDNTLIFQMIVVPTFVSVFVS